MRSARRRGTKKRSIRDDVFSLQCNAVAPKWYTQDVEGDIVDLYKRVDVMDGGSSGGCRKRTIKSCARVATSQQRRDAAMPTEQERFSRRPAGLLPASRHELLLHLSVRRDRGRRACNSSSRRVDDGDGIAGSLG